MTTCNVLVPLVAALLSGCAVERSPAPLSADHPANPDAAEVAFVPPANVLTQDVVAINAESSGETVPATRDHQHARPGETPDSTNRVSAGTDKTVPLSAESQKQIDRLTQAYLALSDMLAKDSVKNAQNRLDTIREAGKSLAMAEDTALKAAAQRVVKSVPEKPDDIAAFRKSFKALSAAVVELVHLAPPTRKAAPGVIKQAYCPMAKAPWLQTVDQIENPYFGSQMLHCGKVTETIKPREDAKE
jgi:Protein of unknown function (DUF3347)